MRKHVAVLFVMTLTLASSALVGVAGAQAPDTPDEAAPTTKAPDSSEQPDAEPNETTTTEAPTTTTTSTTSTTTTTTITPPVVPTTVPPPAPPEEVAGLQQTPGCDPNYLGACVPTGVSGVNCDDIPVKGFQSVGSDPQGLDGDNDGIACEPDPRSGTPAGAATPAPTASVLSATAPEKLAATGGSSEQRYLLSLALVVAGLMAILVSAMVVPEIAVPRRGGFTVTSLNRSGDQIRTRVTSVRSRRRP